MVLKLVYHTAFRSLRLVITLSHGSDIKSATIAVTSPIRRNVLSFFQFGSQTTKTAPLVVIRSAVCFFSLLVLKTAPLIRSAVFYIVS